MKNAIIGTAIVGTLLAASAPLSTAQAGHEVWYPIATWEMNERPNATVLHDSTNDFDGKIGGKVKPTDRRYHYFSWVDHKRKVKGHVNVIPDNDFLDPSFSDFMVQVRVKFKNETDRNIVQKGQGNPAGGIFKMKLRGWENRGIISCLFRGSNGNSYTQSDRRLDDNKWHQIECERTAQGTAMTVDGRVVDQNSNAPGSISNDWPIAIGGNTFCWEGAARRCNYWWGKIDYVRWYD